MFSSRTAWDRSTNRLARLLEARQHLPEPILDLTETNPTRVGLSYPSAEILQALAHPESSRYEPDPKGTLEARRAVARHFSGRGMRVDPEDLFLTASTSEAYSWIFKLLADPGDEVMAPCPSYPLFQDLSRLDSLRIVSYALSLEGTGSLDLEGLASRRSPRTRAVIVVSPNNPTGTYLKRHELRDLVQICREGEMALIGDEVFAEYPAGPDPSRAASVLEAEGVLSFSLGGLSKLGGLPQLKLAWMALGGPPETRREARERLELIADTYLSVNTPVQLSASRLLELSGKIRAEISRRIEANRKTLGRCFGEEGSCRAFPGEGGWMAVLRVPAVMSEEDWVLALLEQDHLLVHPGYFFDFPSPAYLVVSLLPSEGDFQEGVERIRARAARV